MNRVAPNKALQLPANSVFQSRFGSVWHSTWVAQRPPAALLTAAERPVRWAAARTRFAPWRAIQRVRHPGVQLPPSPGSAAFRRQRVVRADVPPLESGPRRPPLVAHHAAAGPPTTRDSEPRIVTHRRPRRSARVGRTRCAGGRLRVAAARTSRPRGAVESTGTAHGRHTGAARCWCVVEPLPPTPRTIG